MRRAAQRTGAQLRPRPGGRAETPWLQAEVTTDRERPHDGIDGDLPCERWEPSPRPYPEKLLAPEYPSSLEVRRVSAAGSFRLKAKQPFLSSALADEYVGLEEVGDGLWDIVYYRTLLGRIDERTGRITGLAV